ncbi:MAG: hypothetical protein JOY78_03705 [Pseudonocardia sp.]|nr:hypothetical protein [Pseudonocardia sp.]
MPAPLARLRQNYAAAFARYLIHRDEAALTAAYELGRSALETRVSLIDIVLIHHEVVIGALPGIEGPQELANAAAAFLVEVLASFEMTQRAFRERPNTIDPAG